MKNKKSLFKIRPGDLLSFGVIKVASGVQFSVYLPGEANCKLKLYRIGRKEPACVIPLTGEYKRGGVYFVIITGISESYKSEGRSIAQILSQDFEYMYEADGREFIDPYVHVIPGKSVWGKVYEEQNKKIIRGGVCLDDFEWGDDFQIRRPFEDVILYQLHVRGYTKHSSSGVKHKGTYEGLREKIPYFKELGVNCLLLLPCYEFNEVIEENTRAGHEIKYNYWGYGGKDVYYLAPKVSYAADKKNPVREFKNLIKSLHEEGIEVLMDIYFLPGTNLSLMTDCLRNWVINYHIDGFRVNQSVMPSIALISDPILSGVKILAEYWDENLLRSTGVKYSEKFLAEYNEGFMNDTRRFLKSDEGMVEKFSNRFKRNSDNYSIINFVTHVNGFTMMDLVSYDVKHNESNGEMNRDGSEYNYSWNCGVEGRSRKQYVVTRRMQQIRNAFLMLLCSQGTPMILAGDEFGNTQYGNNNAYCHDDNVTWLNWKRGNREQEIFDYVKKLIVFRKEHKILRQASSFKMMDSRGYGIPDLSIHGTQAWRADFSYYSRMLAILLNGEYVQDEAGEPDDIIYLIFNMYWESKTFDLPSLPVGKKWYAAITTYDNGFNELPPKVKRKKVAKVKRSEMHLQRKTVVPPRSIVVFVGR